MNAENKTKNKPFKILVDHQPHDWPDQYISGLQIKTLAGVDPSYGVWQEIHGPNEDIPIGDQEKVDLSQKGREHFFTGPTQTTEG
ncbi:MAG: multiubiquitin domain-containing protein [Dissulfuribacterales bacterium]